MKKPLIFITNDDGVDAKGLQELVEVATEFGRVIVVAPTVGQSGMSHAITMTKPLYLNLLSESERVKFYSCSGTPVDCVKMAFDYLMLDREQPSLILSGINHGSNSAINILYSGTMGGAMEASFYDIPSIGFSLTDHSPEADFAPSLPYLRKIIKQVMDMPKPLNEPFCLNVNIPDVAAEDINGIMPCRQNRGYWREKFERRVDPRGQDYFWLTGYFHNTEPEATDTDEWALKHNYISVVPIQADLTNYQQLDILKTWKL